MLNAPEFQNEMERTFFENGDQIENFLTELKNKNYPQNFSDDIKNILDKYENIQKNSIPHIEEISGHTFSHLNLFLIIFLYEEISNIFNDVNNRVTNGSVKIDISHGVFSEIRQIRENFLTLGFIGDRAIELGVIRNIWPEAAPQKIPRRVTLDTNKQFITEGEEQAKLWDILVSDDAVPSSEKSTENKSSRFEAVFGIIYLEGGQDAIEKAILMLKSSQEKS